MVSISVAKGMTIGDHTNPVAHYSGKSFAVDRQTLCFLEHLMTSGSYEVDLELATAETRKSLNLLQTAGLIVIPQNRQLEAVSYRTSRVTDLTIRRRSKLAERAFDALFFLVRPLLNLTGIWAGVTLTIAWLSYWFLVNPPVAETYTAITRQPLVLLPTAIICCFARLLLHELGHYAVARRNGVTPPVGFGLYFTGPVAYVDLSALDTRSRKTRLQADLAGVAIDGFLLTVISCAVVVSPTAMSSALVTILGSAVFGSFMLTEKSDFYWALRDVFGGRSVTECWDRPLRMYYRFRKDPRSRKFLRVLAICYAAVLVFQAVALFRWLPQVLIEFHRSGVAALISPAMVLIGFIGIIALTQLISHRMQGRRER